MLATRKRRTRTRHHPSHPAAHTRPIHVQRTTAGVTVTGRLGHTDHLPTDGQDFTLTLRYRDEARLLRDALWHHGWDHTRQSNHLGTLQIGDTVAERPALMTRLVSEWSNQRPSEVTTVIYWEARRREGHLLFRIPLDLATAAQLHDNVEALAETLPRNPDGPPF